MDNFRKTLVCFFFSGLLSTASQGAEQNDLQDKAAPNSSRAVTIAPTNEEIIDNLHQELIEKHTQTGLLDEDICEKMWEYITKDIEK